MTLAANDLIQAIEKNDVSEIKLVSSDYIDIKYQVKKIKVADGAVILEISSALPRKRENGVEL